MRLAVIIPAAGSSSRFNSDTTLGPRSKLDEDLGGRTVLQRTVELFHTRPETDAIIVAGPHDPDAMEAFRARHADALALLGATLVPGGKNARHESVKAALDAVPEGATHIAVHDAARPACPERLIDRVFEAATKHVAVVPALPADATVKRVGSVVEDTTPDPLAAILGDQPEDPARAVIETVDRTDLVLVQTPQVFERSLIERAYAQDNLSSTDDAGLVERLGEPVVVLHGDPRNLKITRPEDLEVIRAVLGFTRRPF